VDQRIDLTSVMIRIQKKVVHSKPLAHGYIWYADHYAGQINTLVRTGVSGVLGE
jgi:hypothetical protein